MQKIEIKLYEYYELDDDARERVISDIREKLIEDKFYFLDENLLLHLSSMYDLDHCRLYYDLGCSQGDGLSFMCENLLNSKYIIEKVKESLNKNEKATFTKLLKNKVLLRIFSTGNDSGRYCYASEYDIKLGINSDAKKITKLQQTVIDKVESIVQELYLDICDELKMIGYGCYEVDDYEVIDYIENSDYLFYESGELYLGFNR